MWHALRREGIDIGREHTARLMRLAGVSGKGKGRSPITTRKASVPDLRPDLVQREFSAEAPNKLWVADITYVRTKKGFVYAAFVTDVYSRRIVGWALSDSMRTSGFAAASSQPGNCVCGGNNRSHSPFGSRVAVCQRGLQRATCPAWHYRFHRDCW
ncbi:DDE-type integrase/transposase/recombinase [Corynebacterium sp. MNWGS58]|uniref:DDE-type integrase/transposase/recombinase n=1 Tax=Corynebacterium sp. 102791.4 TaxID=3104612 RepID=UPI00351638DB